MNKPSAAEIRATIDAYGEADRRARLWQPAVNPHEAQRDSLRKKILSWYDNADAELTEVLHGTLYRVEVKAKKYQRPISPEVQAKAFARMKQLIKVTNGDIFDHFTTTQESIKRVLGQVWLDNMAPKARTGARDLEVVPLTAPAAEKKAA